MSDELTERELHVLKDTIGYAKSFEKSGAAASTKAYYADQVSALEKLLRIYSAQRT